MYPTGGVEEASYSSDELKQFKTYEHIRRSKNKNLQHMQHMDIVDICRHRFLNMTHIYTYDTQSQHIRSISQHLHKSVDSCNWKVRVGAEKQWLLRCQLDRLDMDPKDSGIPGMYSPRHNAWWAKDCQRTQRCRPWISLVYSIIPASVSPESGKRVKQSMVHWPFMHWGIKFVQKKLDFKTMCPFYAFPRVPVACSFAVEAKWGKWTISGWC